MKLFNTIFETVLLAVYLASLLADANQPANIRVHNGGGYVAKFKITFTDMYDNQVEYWSGDFPVGQSRNIDIPYGAKTAQVYAEFLFFFGVWRELFRVGMQPPFYNRCFKVWGTTFGPAWGEENC